MHDAPASLLRATALLDFQHPAIGKLIAGRGWRDRPVHERIGAVYDFVRNEIAFGYDETDELPASRVLADGGHYPAIDIEQSISRVMHNVADERHQHLARRLKALWSRYQRNRDLISVGAYIAGSDAETDRAIALHGAISAMLQQPMNQRCTLLQAREALAAVLGSEEGAT